MADGSSELPKQLQEQDLAKDPQDPKPSGENAEIKDEKNDDQKQQDGKSDDQKKEENVTPETAEAVVPVDMDATSSAEAALAQFMADESLSEATSAVPDPIAPAIAADPIWHTVDQTLKAPTCRKCLMPCTLENLVNKSKAEGRVNAVCKGCNSATTMLSRNLGKWPLPAFSGLSPEQQVGFWKQCQNIIQKQGRLDYGSIRACLTITLQERQIEIAKANFTSEYLPLSVWVARGFDQEKVRKGIMETHPILGETFAVPLKTVSKEHVREKIEEMITTFEAQVRKRKGQEVSAGASSATVAPVDDDDKDLLEITWLDPKSPAKKRPAEELEEAPDAALPDPKKQRQMAGELRRHNTQVGKLAKKGLDALNPLLAVLMQHQANSAILPAQLAADLKEVSFDLGALIGQCQDGLKTPTGEERLPDLPFDSKSLSSKVKGFKQVFSSADRMMKLINKSGPKAK